MYAVSDATGRQKLLSTLARATMPDGTKPLPELMLTYHQMCSVAFT